MLKFKFLRICAFILLALASPALAQEDNDSVVLPSAESTVRTVEECLQARRDGEFGRAGFRECKKAVTQAEIANQEAIIANQEQILAALNTELTEIGLQIDDQGRILDEQGQELASIVAINGQLVIRRQQVQAETAALDTDSARLDADSEAKLLQAEQTLQRLATN